MKFMVRFSGPPYVYSCCYLCSGVNPFGQTQQSVSAAPVSNPFLPAGQMYMMPPSSQQTGFMQPVPGFNQLSTIAPASGGHFAPPTGVPNGGAMWATQPVIGQIPGQNTWAQPAPPPSAAAANPFLVSLLLDVSLPVYVCVCLCLSVQGWRESLFKKYKKIRFFCRPKLIHCNYQFVHYSSFCKISPSILNRFKPNLQA